MSMKYIPVRALVWLTIDEDGNVQEAELSGDTSWMTLDPHMKAFAEPGRTLTTKRAQGLLNTLIERKHWDDVQLSFDI